MNLSHRTVLSDSVRVPQVERGEVVLVGRYSHDTPKAAIVNPEDLAMLEDANKILNDIQAALAVPVDDLAERVHFDEDRPHGDAITDPARIRALLGL
jgi:hypothetical protein